MSDTLTAPESSDEPENLTIGADPYEKNWMTISVLLLLGFLVTVSVAGFAMGFQVSGVDDEVDPRVVTESGPWADPGVRQISDDEFEAWVIAQTWAFTPREITVPVGAEVKIHVTSPDVQHGMKIIDTNVNMQIVPGQVSVLTYTFDEVGEFPYICHEYCGQGHAAMWGVVNVVPATAATGDTEDAASAEGSDEEAER